MSPHLDEILALVNADGLRTARSREPFAALTPDDALAVVLAARMPQYAARAVELLGAPFVVRVVREAASRQRHDRDATILLGAMLAAQSRGMGALDAGYDDWLADALQSHWADEVHAILDAGVAGLPQARREAMPFRRQGHVAWRYLRHCERASSWRLAVRVAAMDPSADVLPTGEHPIVAGLALVGDGLAPLLTEVLRDHDGTRSGRRILVGALARLRSDETLLRTLLDDPDPIVRRVARDGLDHRGVAWASSARIPNEALAVRALRTAPTADARAALDAALSAVADPAVFDPSPFVGPDPLMSFAVAADLWLRARRLARWTRATPLLDRVMDACVRAASTDPRMARLVADTLCRVPPATLDPMRLYMAFLPAKSPFTDAVAAALGEILSPEDAGNPLQLYDWLAQRASGGVPAFARGLVDPDPRLRLVCERATGRLRAPPPPRDLRGLRAALDAFAASGYFGAWCLVVVDDAAQRCEVLSLADRAEPEGRAAHDRFVAAVDGCVTRHALDADALAEAFCEGDARARAFAWEPVDREAALAALVDEIEGDTMKLTRVEAGRLVEAVAAWIPADATAVRARGVYEAAHSVAWCFEGTSPRRSALFVYVNDQ